MFWRKEGGNHSKVDYLKSLKNVCFEGKEHWKQRNFIRGLDNKFAMLIPSLLLELSLIFTQVIIQNFNVLISHPTPFPGENSVANLGKLEKKCKKSYDKSLKLSDFWFNLKFYIKNVLKIISFKGCIWITSDYWSCED